MGSLGLFSALSQYCRVLKSAFQNTTTVESDFSLVEGKKDYYRKLLADFSLEGIYIQNSTRYERN
jgi:hypothetical protein